MRLMHSPPQDNPGQLYSAYSQPEAYDIINSPGTSAEVDGLERIAARFVLGGPRADAGGRLATRRLKWMEPCSGSGRYLRLIAARMKRAGVKSGKRSAGATARLVGVDFDPGMVGYSTARLERRGLAGLVSVVQGDIRRLNARMVGVAPVDMAFCLHNSVRHLHTEADLLSHLRSVRRVLSKRGVYAVGLELTPPEQMFMSEAVFTGRRGSLHVREVFSYLPPDDARAEMPLETVHIYLELEKRTRAAVDRREIGSTYRLRCWSVEAWERLVRRAGMESVSTVDSAGRDMPAGYNRYAIRVLRVRQPGARRVRA